MSRKLEDVLGFPVRAKVSQRRCQNVTMSVRNDQVEYLHELVRQGIKQSHVVQRALDDFKSKYGYPGLT